MKTTAFFRILSTTTLLAIFLICSFPARSQQIVTFSNGSVMKVNIVYQTKDTIKYYKEGNPDIIFTETMDRVEKIVQAESLRDYKPGPKTTPLSPDKEYWKYKKGVTTGAVLMGTGGILTLAGIIGWSASNDADNPNEVLGAVFSVMGMVLGSGLFVTGGIITIVNSSNLATYKKMHPEVTLRLKSNSQMTGVSLVYRF